MKKVTLLLVFSLFFGFSKAQINFPFPTDSAEWTYLETYGAGGGSYQFTYFYQNDTTINSLLYSKLYKKKANTTSVSYEGAIRTDSSKVFVAMPDSTNEFLLYDFGLQIGDTFFNPIDSDYMILDSTRFISIDNESRKIFYFDSYHTWIEGVGDVDAFFRSFEYIFHEYGSNLKCFHQNDTLVYLNPIFDDCIYDNTGIKESTKINLSISPNPVTNISILKINNTTYQNLKINIYNVNGVLMESSQITNNQYLINASEFDASIHFYRIENDKNETLSTGKIIIK